MSSRPLIALVSVLCCALLAPLTGCSGSSKKKGRTVLMTEYDDAHVGAQASIDVASQIGIVENPELSAYVRGIGRKLLRGVPRRSFRYEFKVVDQVEPNAFALPGGYVFISRGLLLLANDEDELACVIGHEITHVDHRHAATQQALSRHGNPLSFGWYKAARNASYSREMERDADIGGQKLCAAAGYDPMGMSSFLRSLEQLGRLRVGYSRNASFFDTHPASRERAASTAARAGEFRWTRDPVLGDTREALLAQTRGLAVGQRPEAGVFQGNVFLHPDLDFQVRFPLGWGLQNAASAVGATSPRGDAAIYLSADLPAGDPQKVAEEWLAKAKEDQKLEVEESKAVKVGGIDAWRLKLKGRSPAGMLTSYMTFIPYGEMTWRFTGLTLSRLSDTYAGTMFSVTRSFGPLTEEQRESITIARLETAKAIRGEDLPVVSRRSHNVWELSTLAVYNGLFTNHRFKGGELVKVARDEPHRSSPPD
jgi:predicted Zn-dependent protease